MTDEPKRRSYAVDDVETISRRMKEIAAERNTRIAETELPSDVEPTGFGLIPMKRDKTVEADLTCGGATLVKQEDGSWLWVVLTSTEILQSACAPSIYSDAYWQPLIDAGVLSMGDCVLDVPIGKEIT